VALLEPRLSCSLRALVRFSRDPEMGFPELFFIFYGYKFILMIDGPFAALTPPVFSYGL